MISLRNFARTAQLSFLTVFLLFGLLSACGSAETPTQPVEAASEVPTQVPTEPAPTSAPHTDTPTPEPGVEPTQAGLVLSAQLMPVQDEPVLIRGEAGEWDSVVMRFPYVLYAAGTYHLFYEARQEFGQSSLAIGYAFSEDGLHWEKHPDNPIFSAAGSGFDSQAVARPVVSVDDAGTWTMYYTGSNPGGVEAIGRATSTSPSGPWDRAETPLLQSGPPGAWDEELILADQAVEIQGQNYLYYSGRAASGQSAMIGLAISSDGLEWTKYNDPSNDGTSALFAESDPILINDQGWDRSAVWTPNIFSIDAGWMMIYNAEGSLGIAVSADGIDWIKYEGNPIHRDASLFHPAVVRRDDGSYWIYYRNLSDESMHLLEAIIQVD
jgi:hypothetical protein